MRIHALFRFAHRIIIKPGFRLLTRGSLLAAGITLAACSLLSVPSGPGVPMGPSFRTATHVLSLIATDEPHAPALQPNQVAAIPQKVGLLLTPLDGSPAPAIVEIARNVDIAHNVPSSSDPIRILAVNGDQVWILAGQTYLYDLRSHQLGAASNPPKQQEPPTVPYMVTSGWKVSATRWLGLHLPEDVEKGKLKPGSPVMPGIFPLRSVPYEFVRDGQLPTRERRQLYLGQIDASGPIPRFTKVDPVSPDEYPNGVVLIESIQDDGAIIAYEGRFPDLTLHLRRIDTHGQVQWTADTRILRDLQILPSADARSGAPLALRGVPQVPDGTFPQPILVLADPHTGKLSTTQLKW